MTDSNIIEKIQKMLALATDSRGSPEESQNALLMAQRMMAKNNLVVADVNVRHEEKDVVNDIVKKVSRQIWWHITLARIIADNFKCHLYFVHKYEFIPSTKSSFSKISPLVLTKFIGLKEDVEIANKVYNYAVEAIDYSSIQYMIKKKKETTIYQRKGMKNNYIFGYMEGLKEKFAEQVKSNTWGLIIVKDPAVQSVFDKLKVGKGKKRTIKVNNNEEDNMNGYEDGKNFNYVSGKIT